MNEAFDHLLLNQTWHSNVMIKLFSIALTLCFAAAGTLLAETIPPASFTPGQTGSITVHIKDLKNNVGMLGVSLYNSKKGFPAKYEQAYANQLKKITGTSETVVFENIPFGNYAVSVTHDENSNGKLEKNFIGMPKEGVGVSNNPKIGMGGPKFNDCVFTLNTRQLELTVPMMYL